MKKATLSLLLWSTIAICQSKTDSLPLLNTRINDFEDLFELHQEILLNESIETFYKKTGIEITIVTTNSVKPYDNIFEYSLYLANKSKRGKILIVVSKTIREIQIQNSDDIVEKLTDKESKDILDSFILPKFKEGDYFQGLLTGIAEIKKEF